MAYNCNSLFRNILSIKLVHIILLLFVLAPLSAIAQSGDSCSTAINLAGAASPLSSTTVGAGNNFTSPCLFTNNAPDLVYYIEVPNGAVITMGLTAVDYDSEIYLSYGANCNERVHIDCYNNEAVQNVVWENTTGRTQNVYWIQDGGNSSNNAGTFTLAWSLTQPADCIKPRDINVNPSPNNTLNVGWLDPAEGESPAGGYEYAVTTSPIPPSTGIMTTETSVLGYGEIENNTIYYFHLRTHCSTDEYSEWATSQPFQNATGEDCLWPIDLNGLTSPYTGTTYGRRNNYWNSCSPAGNGSPDAYFSIYVPIGYTLRIRQTQTNYNAAIRVGTGSFCYGEIFACYEGIYLEDITYVNTATTLKEVHWIQDGIGSPTDAGSFTIEWELIRSNHCFPPINIIPLVDPDGTATVSWSANTEGDVPVSYEYAVTTSVTPPVSGILTNTSSITYSILPATIYYLHVRANCEENSSEWVTSRPFQNLEGQYCNSAINLATLSSPFTGTTTDAINDSNTCFRGYRAPEKNYYIEVPDGYSLNINVDSNYNEYIRLGWGGSCPGDNEISCTGSPYTDITWENHTGQSQVVYYIQDGFNEESGDFTTSWNLAPPPVCEPPIITSVRAESDGSAHITWTPPTNGLPRYDYDYAVTTSPEPPTSVMYTTNDHQGNIISGIEHNVNYYAHVQTHCTDNSYSEWATSAPFKYLLPDTCEFAVDLSTLTSEVSCDNRYSASDFTLDCAPDNSLPDLVYYVNLPDGHSIHVSYQPGTVISLAYGGACPGETQIACDTVNGQIGWGNYTGASQVVYLTLKSGAYLNHFNWSILPVTCVPQDIMATPTSPTTANLSWTVPENTSTTGFEYAVTTTPDVIPEDVIFTTNTLVTNFQRPGDDVDYYLLMRSLCGVEEYGIWVYYGPFRFLMGDTCDGAVDLESLSVPYTYSTLGANDNYTLPCSNNSGGPDVLYYMNVPDGDTFRVQQPVTDYHYQFYMGYGGVCPGEIQIACVDYLNPQDVIWQNTTGAAQTVYWVIDGYTDNQGGSRHLLDNDTNNVNAGQFTLSWLRLPTALGINTPLLNANDVVVYKEDKSIKISTRNINIAGITIYDVRGSVLYNEQGFNATQKTISTLMVQQQVLIVEVTTLYGKIMKRIVF